MKALLFSLLLAGCAAASGALSGTHWRMNDSVGARAPTLEFNAEDAGGFSGCNHWFGAVATRGQSLSFTNVGGTEMACEPPAMEVERRFYDMLLKVRSHRMEGGALVLLDGSDAELARFSRAE